MRIEQVKKLFLLSILALQDIEGRAPCAPITNIQNEGTWSTMLSTMVGHCQQGYDHTNPECDFNAATAGAETGSDADNQQCIFVDKSSTQPYPSYTQCTSPKGNSENYTMPNGLTQAHYAIQNILPNMKRPPLFFILLAGNDIFDNILKEVGKKARSGIQKNTALLNQEGIASSVKTSKPIKNIKKIISTIISAGIPKESIYLINLPNFAQVPAAILLAKQYPKLEKVILKILEVMSFFINAELAGAVSSNQLIKLNELFKEMHQHPEQFNLNASLLTSTCIEAKRMPQCEGLIFFNGKHPVKAVHQYMAKQAYAKVGAKKLADSSLITIGDSLSDDGNNVFCNELDKPKSIFAMVIHNLVSLLQNTTTHYLGNNTGINEQAAKNLATTRI